MTETPARVVRVEGDVAWVVTESPTSCGACGGKGCGSSLYARMLHPREPEYPVDNLIAAQVGEWVVVGIPDGILLRAAVAAYVVPLALVLLGSVVGMAWGELQAMVGAGIGLALSLVWWKTRRVTARPALLRRGATGCATS